MSFVASPDISRALLIGGWMSERELIWLATQAQCCDNIVEFGSFHGRSTRALADNVKPYGRIFAVDPWNGDYPDQNGKPLPNVNTAVMPYFLANLRDKIDDGTVIPHRGYSKNFSLPFTVDMVFLDGDHRYKTVLSDIEKARQLTRPGGLICGHDYAVQNWDGVEKAVKESFEHFGVEDTIWYAIKF